MIGFGLLLAIIGGVLLCLELEHGAHRILSERGQAAARAMQLMDPAKAEWEWDVESAWIDREGNVGGSLSHDAALVAELRALPGILLEREQGSHWERLERFPRDFGPLRAVIVRQELSSVLAEQREQTLALVAGLTGLTLLLFLALRFNLERILLKRLRELRQSLLHGQAPPCDSTGDELGQISSLIAERMRQEQRVARAIEGSGDGHWHWLRRDGEHQWWSPGMRALLGLPQDSPATLTLLFERIVPEDRAALQAALDSNARIELELRVQGADGEPRWHCLHAQSLGEEIAGSLRDIHATRMVEEGLRQHASRLETAKASVERSADELVRSMQALSDSKIKAEAAARTKSEFLANMSHEIRTPLTAMMGYADLLLDSSPGAGDSERSHLRTIRSNGEHLLTIINDILDISKVEAGCLQIEQIRFSLEELLLDVVALVRASALAKGLQLQVSSSTGIPAQIESDPTRLRQILLNLIGNAVKFTEEGRVDVEVAYEAATSQLAIRVRDTGIGIAQEKLPQLFQPFSQADSSTTRRFGGTGLGLVISQRLAQMLGGHIEVESELGQGSCFTLHLRVRGSDEQLERALPQSGDTPLPSLNGWSILLAEDGRDNQRLISLILQRAGARTELASDGLEAVKQALSPSPYDVILMDMQMPVLDGYEATRRIREAGCQTPIIAVTAHALEEDRQRCIEAGCDDFATKPIRRSVLLETIMRWRDGRAQQQTRIH
jgi:signal transduction histidine kinase/ActR/RegA family two-component response regulator